MADGGLELGVLTAFLLYLRQFYDPMEDVAIFYNSLQSATAALEKIAARAGRARRRCPSPTDAGRAAGAGRAARVELDDGRVRLPRRPAGAARAVDLTIPAGQTVALVGATGAGKTTIAKLHLALLRPDRRRGARSTASTCATSPTPSCAARS